LQTISSTKYKNQNRPKMIYGVAATFAVLATVASGSLYSKNAVNLKYMFESFKQEYGKTYATMDEEAARYNIFVDNLRIIDDRNTMEINAGGSAQHGITKFSDWTQAEFEAKMLNSDVSMRSANREYVEVPPYEGVQTLVDWSGRLTTPVKNQGYCGSCWAFSATEQIESDSMRTLGTSYILSPEQITQCDTTSYGCNGGWTERAYNYVNRAGGIETEANYPYTSYYGVTGTCSAQSTKYVIGVSGYKTISGESAMASYVQSTGPLSVCLDASSWNSYTGGIMTVCGKSVDHCVQAVGVDASSGGYWKVRNSWGTSWGEAGYIRLAYGANTCAITNDPTYVTVFKK
jgi:C1A family cysteine protease